MPGVSSDGHQGMSVPLPGYTQILQALRDAHHSRDPHALGGAVSSQQCTLCWEGCKSCTYCVCCETGARYLWCSTKMYNVFSTIMKFLPSPLGLCSIRMIHMHGLLLGNKYILQHMVRLVLQLVKAFPTKGLACIYETMTPTCVIGCVLSLKLVVDMSSGTHPYVRNQRTLPFRGANHHYCMLPCFSSFVDGLRACQISWICCHLASLFKFALNLCILSPKLWSKRFWG